MTFFKNRKMVSIFKHYFIILTCLVLFCLFISSLSLFVLVAATWSSDLQQTLLDGCIELSLELYKFDSATAEIEAGIQLSTEMQRLAQQTSADFFIVDSSGKIIFCIEMLQAAPGSNDLSIAACPKHNKISFSKESIDSIHSNTKDFLQKSHIDIDNENYILTAVPASTSDDRQLYIFAIQPLSVAYQPYVAQYMKMIIAASCIAVLMAFFSSLAVSYRIVRPLRKMVEATKHYAIGDFSYRIRNAGRYSEFNELATAFNLMAKNLEEYESSRRNFVANVSHELKTPMTTISGFIDGILDGTIPPEEETHYLKIVSEVVKHLSELVVSMLNMSKIEAGKVQLKYSQFLFDSLIIQTIVGFEKIITDKNIDVIGLDRLTEIKLRADEALIRQVIYNLIDNAVKFTQDDGLIKLELFEEKGLARFSITNTGITIPQDELNKIFDRFYKIDKSRGLDAASFGLGLYIVRSIVEMHGGTIKASSKDDYTKFTVLLPVFNIH